MTKESWSGNFLGGSGDAVPTVVADRGVPSTGAAAEGLRVSPTGAAAEGLRVPSTGVAAEGPRVPSPAEVWAVGQEIRRAGWDESGVDQTPGVPTEPHEDAQGSERDSPIGRSLAEWGETKITWNSVHKNKTYLEVFAMHPQYVKWTDSHATASMADWVAFIAAMRKPVWR